MKEKFLTSGACGNIIICMGITDSEKESVISVYGKSFSAGLDTVLYMQTLTMAANVFSILKIKHNHLT